MSRAVPAAGGDRPCELDRAGRLDDYHDWPAVRGARRTDKVLRGLAGATDAFFVPLVLLTPSVGLTMWSAVRGLASAIDRVLVRHRRVVRRMLLDWDDAMPCTVAELGRLPQGTAVRVRGRARLRRALPSLLDPARHAACCRVLVREELLPGRAFFVERGHDFDLVDEHGAVVRVLVAHARLASADPPALQTVAGVAAARLCRAVPAELFGKRPLEEEHVAAAELSVAQDSEIEVHGLSARVVDPTAPALPRDLPLRAALVGRPERPLLVISGPATAMGPGEPDEPDDDAV